MMESSAEQSCIALLNSSMMKDQTNITDCGKMMPSTLEIQPWIAKFKAMCITDRCNDSSLMKLMAYFIRNVQPIANECQTKPLRADKLKGFISETLLFFLYYYRSQEENYNRTAYMDLMSDLLAMYIDMELKASKRSTECHERISGRIASYLYVYLENSAEHLIDTLLKVRLMSSTYYQILNPLIGKIFRVIPEQPSSSLMYVRYFLVYRIWKRITKDPNARNEINTRALTSLRSPTSFPQHVMDHVLPKVPKTQKISAKFLLSQHIELEKSCATFVQFCRKSKGLGHPEDVEQNRLGETIETLELEDTLQCQSNLSTRENSVPNNSFLIIDSNQSKDPLISSATQIDSTKPVTSNALPRRTLKRSGEIVLIDLTSDDAKGKIIKQKKTRKRSSWIQNILRRKSTMTTVDREDSENVKEDFQRLEDTCDLQSLMISTDCKEIKLKLSDMTLEQFLEMDDDSIEENSDLSTTNSCVHMPETIGHPRDVEINSRIESEEILTDNVDGVTEVQTSVDVNAELEVTTTKTNTEENELDVKNYVDRLESVYRMEVMPSEPAMNVNKDFSAGVNPEPRSTNLDSTEYPRSTVLHINKPLEASDCKEDETSPKIRDPELHEHHIDGLSLLASVSQRVSHLTTAPNTINKAREIIKVKDYNSLMTFESTDHTQGTQVYENQALEITNSIVHAYPDDDIDKVALHVEVSSSDDISDPCTSTVYSRESLDNNYYLPNGHLNESPSTVVQVDSFIQSDKDETNVILNGETIVLLQKAPNSNLYIINKAVENREHMNEDDDQNNVSEKSAPMVDKVGEGIYPYEMYDSMYRIAQPVSSAMPFDLSSESRRSAKVKPDLAGENVRALDLKNPIKQKNPEVMSPRRRRVKQEFNGCANGLQNHMGNPSCQDLVDAHTRHIPPSTSLSSMYHSNYTTGELYISCRQNCSSVACTLPVNHPAAPLHPSAKSSRCSCMDCAYDIVTHCSQCIMPPGKTDVTSSIDAGYYIPMQQPSVIQDCSIEKTKQFDETLICKIEAELNEQKQPKIYEAEINSKLPLKKRYKSLMPASFANTGIKTETVERNYPGTPMMSIAALESDESVETSAKLIVHEIHSEEIIRRDYGDEVINSYHDYPKNRENKGTEVTYSVPNVREIKRTKGQIGRPSKKVKELQSPTTNAPRQTRSSQRKVPKINYTCMDVESECNPSVQTKRKRKKTSR